MAPANPRGITPMMVMVALLMVTLRPSTEGSALKRRRQTTSLSTTTGAAPGSSPSAAPKVRPSCGRTPSTSK
jgi:hypothetical protein